MPSPHITSFRQAGWEDKVLSFSVQPEDYGKIYALKSSLTMTLPDVTSVQPGFFIACYHNGLDGALTVAAEVGQFVRYWGQAYDSLSLSQSHCFYEIVSSGTEWLILQKTPQGIVQHKFIQDGAYRVITKPVNYSDVLPQPSDFETILSLEITPIMAGSILEIESCLYRSFVTAGGSIACSAIYETGDSEVRAVGSTVIYYSGVVDPLPLKTQVETTSCDPLHFHVGVNGNSTVFINGNSSTRLFGGKIASYLSVKEIVG